MQITFLAINYWPSVGGSQTLVQRVAEGLVAQHGHEVRVLTTDALHAPGGSDPGRVRPARETISGVRVQRLPVARRTQSVLRSLRALGARFGRPIVPSVPSYGPWGAQLARAAHTAGRRSDVVVGVSAPFTTIPLAWSGTRRTAAAFVAAPLLHLGEWEPSRHLVRVLAAADRCIALTGGEQSWMVAHGLAAERVEIVPPGVDPAPDRPDVAGARYVLGLGDGPVVTFLGRLAAQKGLDTLLDALPVLLEERPDLTLVLAGQRTAWTGWKDMLRELPPAWSTRVAVIESFDESRRAELLAASDLVIAPSREEAFGIVLLEAWAACRAVVASDLPAFRSVVHDGSDGRLVPVGDPVALGSVVLELLEDPASTRRLGRAGHQRVLDEFRWEHVVDRWNEVLVAAIASHSAPSTAAASTRRSR